jgi:DNA-binding response OmpR family regulator
VTEPTSAAPSSGHRVLIVEDDPFASEILTEIILALGDRPRVAATVKDAQTALSEEDYCYFLVDQELPAYPGARPLEGGGERVMAAVRAKDRRRHEAFHVTPIIVVTGFASDHEFVSRMYDAGADAFFLKPLGENVGKLYEKIRVALERGKRVPHDLCAAYALRAASPPVVAPAPLAASAPLRLALDGVTRSGKTSFLANGERRELQDAKFGVLVRFVAAHLTSPGAMTPKASLGLARSRDATTRVRQAFAGLVPEGFQVIEGDRRGQFRLHPDVVIERVDWEALAKHPDAAVKKVATEQLAKGGKRK